MEKMQVQKVTSLASVWLLGEPLSFNSVWRWRYLWDPHWASLADNSIWNLEVAGAGAPVWSSSGCCRYLWDPHWASFVDSYIWRLEVAGAGASVWALQADKCSISQNHERTNVGLGMTQSMPLLHQSPLYLPAPAWQGWSPVNGIGTRDAFITSINIQYAWWSDYQLQTEDCQCNSCFLET